MAGEEYSFNSIRKALYIQGSTDRTSSFGIVSGGQYNATLPTLSDGAFTHFQTDNRGRLLVDMNGVTFTGDVNVDAFQTQAGVGADAKVNNNSILVVQTGAGTDSSTMADEIATESTATAISSKLTTINNKLVSGTVIGDVNAVQSGTWDVVSNSQNIATEDTLASIETEVTTELEPHYNPDADETPVELKASSGKLHYVHVYNPNAYDVRLQLFNIAAASVVLGTTPIRVPLRIPAQGYGWIDLNTKCVGFDTAMSYAITKTDNTSALDTDAEITIFYR